MDELISRQAAIDEILRLTRYDTVRSLYEATVANKYEDCYEDGIMDALDVIIGMTSPQPERKTGEWIPCKTPPNDGRSVFIAYGSGGLGTVCIGYYDPDDKCWREHKNWFASLLSGVKYWCEIPELPDGWKEEDDG